METNKKKKQKNEKKRKTSKKTMSKRSSNKGKKNKEKSSVTSNGKQTFHLITKHVLALFSGPLDKIVQRLVSFFRSFVPSLLASCKLKKVKERYGLFRHVTTNTINQ